MSHGAGPKAAFQADRVRANTATVTNARIDAQIAARVRSYMTATKADISRRIDELNQEWDIERVLQLNASALALSGLLLGATRSRRWLVVPGFVLTFLAQQATQGWCLPVPLLRRLGFRTRREIDRERYALKVLRGDFERSVSKFSNTEVSPAERALRAVSR